MRRLWVLPLAIYLGFSAAASIRPKAGIEFDHSGRARDHTTFMAPTPDSLVASPTSAGKEKRPYKHRHIVRNVASFFLKPVATLDQWSRNRERDQDSPKTAVATLGQQID